MSSRPTGRAGVGGLVRLACAAAGAIALLAGCSNKGAPAPSGTLRVVATIPPAQGIVEPLLKGSGLKYDLQTLLPPGASEHGFEVSPDKLAALGKADVVVMIGLGMEPQVEKFLAEHPASGRRVIVLGRGMQTEPEHADEHEHDHPDHADPSDQSHAHHGADPHVWLDPIIVEGMAVDCAKELREAAPAGAERIDAARSEFVRRAGEVHGEYISAIGHCKRETIVVAHDAYGYLARRYQLEVIAITGLNAGEPQPADIKRAADVVREKHLTTIFVEPQLSPAAAQRLAAATGAKTAVLDPLGDGDWFKLMDKNLAALKDALGWVAPEDRP